MKFSKNQLIKLVNKIFPGSEEITDRADIPQKITVSEAARILVLSKNSKSKTNKSKRNKNSANIDKNQLVLI